MKKILINAQQDQYRTALMEGGRLVELLVDRREGGSLTGRIYTGLVKEILPSQFAFIDLGIGQNAFLYLADRREQGRKLKRGQRVLVQVIRDAVEEKGPAVTGMISLTGRYIVLFHLNESDQKAVLGISRKIEDPAERERLRSLSLSLLPDGCGVVLRTSCRGIGREELEKDIQSLFHRMDEILTYGQYRQAPALLYGSGTVFEKSLLELLSDDVEEIWINNSADLEEAARIVKSYDPENRVRLYEEEVPLFQRYEVESQVKGALKKKVWLPSGGFITLEQTEACVVIDVNSGKYSGWGDHEGSSLRLNREAAREIARQIRLRNLSGIIIIDFVKLKKEEAREELVDFFRQEVQGDRIPVHVMGLTALGLMELTRKKTRESLSRLLESAPE